MHSWVESVLTKVRNHINENLHLATCDVEDSCSVTEILLRLGISEKDYYSVLSKWKANDYGLHFIRQQAFCFVNKYVDIGLSAWEASFDIQLVFNQ